MIPLVLWSLSFIAGAASGLALPGRAEPLFLFLAFPGAGLAILSFLRPVMRGARVSLVAFLLFSLGGLRSHAAELAFDRRGALFPAPVEGTFRGHVAEDPEVLFERIAGGHETGRVADAYAPAVERVRAVVVFDAVEGRPILPIRVRCSFIVPREGGAPVLSYGDRVEVRGTLSPPPVALNPGQFDYAGYLRNRGVSHVMFATPRRWTRLGPGGGSTFGRVSYAGKRRVEDAVTAMLPYPENALLAGLLLGERASLSNEMLDAFNLTGTTHILAVSGMNTALIAALLFLGFRVLRAPRKAAALLSMVALGAYVVMTGAPPSVCRAGLFSGLALLAVVMERRPHAGVLLCLTAAVLTAFSPLGLTDLSFQLSFLAVMGLAVFSPPVLRAFARFPQVVAVDLAATFGAQMAVWGLLVTQFNQFTTWALPANVLIAPLVALATAGGFAALLAHFLLPPLGVLLGAGVEVPLRLITSVTAWLSGWPAAEIVVGTPPSGWILAYHALLLATFLCFWPRRAPEAPSADWNATHRRFRAGRRIVMAAWGVFLTSAAAAGLLHASSPRPFRVSFLAVGHGSSTVLRSPAGETVVVDGGKGTDGPARWSPLVRYLRHEGIGRVDAIVNTHPDEDHLGGLIDLVRAAKVGRAFQPDGSGFGTRTAFEFNAILSERGIPLVYLRRGDRPDLLEGAGTLVLHPPARFRTRRGKENNLSLVLRVAHPEDAPAFVLTLPGDVEKEGLEAVAGTHPAAGGWLVAPHHGRASGEPGTAVRLFGPEVLIVSDSKGHPELRDAFGPAVKVLELSRTGCVEVSLDARRVLRTILHRVGTR